LPDAAFSPAAENNLAEQVHTHFFLQTKLAIGSPDDPLEHEANLIGDNIMHIPEQNFSTSSGNGNYGMVQRKPLESFIQRKDTSSKTESENITQQINLDQGKGNSLDGGTQSFMQTKLGSSFEHVKIHTDEDAVRMNRELNAKAFTVGSDIYFNKGEYSPHSIEGKQLLAHELVHVIQQSNMVQRKEGNEASPWSKELKDELDAGHYFSAYLLLTDHLGWKNYPAKKAWLAEPEHTDIRYLFLKKLPSNILAEFYGE
jgi:hypothetical protein